jgi:Holliday junction resolvase
MTRGIQDERNLVRLLWKRGFAVVRAPASGAATPMPRPDIIAGHSGRGVQFAIEVKTTRKETLYVARKSVRQLIDFSERFGCRPILAIKFKGKRRPWVFMDPQQLDKTPAYNFKTTFTEAVHRGFDIQTLVREEKAG